MRTDLSDEEIAILLEKRLGRHLNPTIWGYMVAKRYTGDFRDMLEDGRSEKEALDALAEAHEEIEQLVQDASMPAPSRKRKRRRMKIHPSSPPSYRTQLLWIATSIIAAQHPQVRHFREKYLHNALLSPEEIEPWIEARQKEEKDSLGQPYTITLPPGHRLELVQENGSAHLKIEPPLAADEIPSVKLQPSDWETTLEYEIPQGKGIYAFGSVPILPGGALDALRKAADAISSKCRWDKAEATFFVLTGEPGHVHDMSIATHFEVLPELRRASTCFTIKLSPEIGPERLKRFYGEVRRKDALEGRRRIRPLSKKVFNMAKFVMTNPQLDTWQKRFEEWNRQFPQWGYRSPLAMQQAYSRIRQELHLPTATQITELVKVPEDSDSRL